MLEYFINKLYIKAPYFWVSTNWNVGNIDYGNYEFVRRMKFFIIIEVLKIFVMVQAIYLLRRNMRNQEKFALNETETVKFLFV